MITKKFPLIFFTVLFLFVQIRCTEAQSIEILGGNTLNGALTGTILGGATMALRNSNDFNPARIGLGLGTLFGLGVGIYDLSQVSAGAPYYISGTFNDGNNSSIIVLLDTFYGAAAGAVIASSFQLISNEPLLKGLQYGSGVGTFIGFGFGLIDAFALAQKPGDFNVPQENGEDGEVSFYSTDRGVRVSLLEPAVYTIADISGSSMEIRYASGIRLFRFHVGL